MSATLQERIESCDYAGLIEKIYSASLSSDRWTEVLADIGTVMPEVASALWGMDLMAHEIGCDSYFGISPEAFQQFSDYYLSISPWAAGLLELQPGLIEWTEKMISRDDLFKTEFYNDWAKPQENLITCVGTALVKDNSRYLGFAVTIRAQDEDNSNAPMMAFFDRISPHMARSFRLARIISGTELNKDLETVLEHVSEPAFLLDSLGRVRSANTQAASVFSDELATMDVKGKLHFSDPDAQSLLEHQLFDIATRAHTRPAQNFKVRSAEDDVALGILAPFAKEPELDSGFLSMIVADKPVAILILRRQQQDMSSQLQRDFQLTTAELGVALALAEGKSVKQYAETLDISVHTVRNHLRVVFDKMDVRRQSELVAKLHKMR